MGLEADERRFFDCTESEERLFLADVYQSFEHFHKDVEVNQLKFKVE